MSRLIKGIFLTGIFLSFSFSAFAAVQASDTEVARIIVGGIKVFPTNIPSRVVIGNPKIADIVDVTNTEITITGKSAGETMLAYWDLYGEQSVKIKVLAEDMDAIKGRADLLIASLGLPEVHTQIAEDEAKLLILGRVKLEDDKKRIETALGTLKDKVVDLTQVKEEETVVEIDVQVLELNKDATKTLGFTWPGSLNLIERGAQGFNPAGTAFGSVFRLGNIQRAIGNVVDPYTLKLDALIREGKARILSRPRLSCQSGKEAQLLVGGEKPIFSTAVQGDVGTTSTSVDYKEFGIKLKINPLVNDEGRIKLALNVEVSDVGAVDTIGPENAPTAKAFPLSKRSASTELFLDDGETMAIGGLIKQKTDEELRKFPFLADVPILGAFFRRKEVKSGGGIGERGDTELFITLTPRVISRDTPKIKEKDSVREELARQEIVTAQTAKIPENLVSYSRAVQIKILSAVYYPKEAKDAGWGGSLRLGLNIASDGSLKDVEILQTSGYRILDDAARDAALKQAPYPPFPPQIDSEEVFIEVPVVYKKN